MHRVDSIIITTDTLVNGLKYYVLQTNTDNFQSPTIELLRDSSGYVVNHEGKVKFAENNFDDILRHEVVVVNDDTIVTVDYKMENSMSRDLQSS
jgi:hypothetical protein